MIRKVPLSKQRFTPQLSFPKMPKLYLELIENKDKVKQHLVNKEYIPSSSPTKIQPLTERLNELTRDEPPTVPLPQKPTLDVISEANTESSSDSDTDESEEVQSLGMDDDDDSVSADNEDYYHSHSSRSSSHSSQRPTHQLKSTYATHQSQEHHQPSKPYDYNDNPPQSYNKPPESYNEPPQPQFDKITEAFQEGGYPMMRQQEELPSLNDLNMHRKVLPNIQNMETNTEEEDLKRELLFKFELLKKSYKDITIPDFTIHSDYKMMKRSYDNTVKRVSIDSSVDSYKTYLIGGFMLVEFVLGNWLKFDMQGFTQQQIMSMSTYERLLIELGEKSYVDEESQWPVEVRLLGLIIMNAAFFIVSKMIMKKTGSNIMNMINSMNMKNQSSTPQAPKRKMKGPNIDIDNLPDLSSFTQ